MKIDVYAVCWNEERMLPYFLRHYAAFARSITVFDNHSTDRSRQIVAACPNARVELFDTGDEMRSDILVHVKETAWRDSSADYVIVCDTDELVYHADLVRYIERHPDVSVFRATGWEMVSQSFPTVDGQIYDEVTRGVYNPWMSKPCLLDPRRVAAMNFGPGCHDAQPEHSGLLRQNDRELKLLHFKWLGVDYVNERHRLMRQRRSAVNKQRGWGVHYLESDTSLRRRHNDMWDEAIDVIGTAAAGDGAASNPAT